MKVGVIGSGGREHAICISLKKSKNIDKIYCFPGNAGTSFIAENIEIELDNFDKLKRIIKEGIRVVLNEADSMTSEQMKFAKPIFQAAAKKGGFKIGKIYMSFQPQAEITVYEFGKTSSNMTSIWGHAFTKSDAMKLKKTTL